MGYQIIQTEYAEITMFSSNNINMDSDNVILENSVLGSECVNDWNMTSSANNWNAINSTILYETFDTKSCCKVTVGSTADSGISQGSVQKPLLLHWLKGDDIKLQSQSMAAI